MSILFQFHKGTIRTETVEVENGAEIKFQFHKGTIRTLLALALYQAYSHFNSIKVQLEQARNGKADNFIPYFNSIKVQLEPSTLLNRLNAALTFQFHKGTIRTMSFYKIPLRTLISIP